MADLLSVISRVESANKVWPPRLEAHKLGKHGSELLRLICSFNGGIGFCSVDTADMIAACSWGVYQIMGNTLYAPIAQGGLACEISIYAFLGSPSAQALYCNKYLLQNGVSYTIADILNDPLKRAKLAEAYNGPGAVDAYSEKLRRAAIDLSTDHTA